MQIKVNGVTISVENSPVTTGNLALDNLEKQSIMLSRESEDITKMIKLYDIMSDVKAVESFGYRSTEGVGEKIKKGLSFIWRKIKEIFKKIGAFFIGIFKTIKGWFVKQPKQNVQFVAKIASDAIMKLPDGNYKSEQFARLLLEAPEVKTAKNEIVKAKSSNQLGDAAEKIGGVTKIAENNWYVAGLIGYEPEQVVKICAPASAYPETDGTPEKKDFIDEYRKAVNLVFDDRVRGEAVNVAVLANHAIKQIANQDNSANFRGSSNPDAIDKIVNETIKPAIEKYEQPYQKVEGVKNAKAEFKKVCDAAANGGFDSIDSEERQILSALNNFHDRLDETIVLFDDYADHDALKAGDKNVEQRLDENSNMNKMFNKLRSNLSTDMKYFNLSITSLKRVIDAKVGIAMIVSKLSNTVKYEEKAAA